jgi:hypothetical protein
VELLTVIFIMVGLPFVILIMIEQIYEMTDSFTNRRK